MSLRRAVLLGLPVWRNRTVWLRLAVLLALAVLLTLASRLSRTVSLGPASRLGRTLRLALSRELSRPLRLTLTRQLCRTLDGCLDGPRGVRLADGPGRGRLLHRSERHPAERSHPPRRLAAADRTSRPR